MRALVGTYLVVALGACSTFAPISDGTSLSWGSTSRGELAHASELPVRGDGYLIPPTWAGRNMNFGTDELVALLVRATRRVAREEPGVPLYVGDLSAQRGGATAWHKSHQAGRDADLIFFAVDDDGRPAPVPTAMRIFDENGATVDGGRRYYFHTARNWALVRALLEDPDGDVQFLFVAHHLRKLLLDYAAAQGEPADLVERAEAVLLQPGDSLPHDDHLHVRIYCPASDLALGCRERGPLRWLKKGYKYATERMKETLADAPSALRPFCQLVGAGLVALQ
jgi:penicillin-insensitive murein endopeptidase